MNGYNVILTAAILNLVASLLTFKLVNRLELRLKRKNDADKKVEFSPSSEGGMKE